jgi:C1A family cysteine protease
MTLPISPAGRRYGYIQNPPDHRDFGLSSLPMPSGPPPSSFSLKEWLGPVKDQGDEGSCTAHAGTENFEFLYRKYKGESPIFSPAFLYYQERVLDGSTTFDDEGSTGRSSCKAMNQFGVCLESEWPYVAGQYSIPPTPGQLSDALAYRSGAYHFLTTVGDMKACIASGYCFMIGFAVYESFERIGSDGVMPVPDKVKEQVLGGHEVLCYGYSDARGMLSVLNSWGTSFGDGGTFYMPYSVAADKDILMDAAIQHLGPGWRAAPPAPVSVL